MLSHRDAAGSAATTTLHFAGMTGLTTIAYTLLSPYTLSSLTQIRIFSPEQEIPVIGLSTLGIETNGGMITVGIELDLRKEYLLQIEGLGCVKIIPTGVFDSEEFIRRYTYDGDDLGATIQCNGSTTFKVWAPTASKVTLNLFAAGNGVEAFNCLEMRMAERGVWALTVPHTGHGTYYTYTVTTSAGTQEAADPYAKACGINGKRSMVVNLPSTDPANWENDRVVALQKYTDAILWEIHVRDFSNSIEASRYKGKYLAFTEQGLRNRSGVAVGVDYLLQLGVTHLHLQPVYDYASVDEEVPSFNWGYDPANFNCLEGSYSTDAYHGEVRIHEFKRLVQALHAKGLGVVMDVVYNHTFDANSNLNKIVPYYYYRYDGNGYNTSQSGCGNDTASERIMYRKFMVDSVRFWATEYHLDGFRFDLMGLHDVDTMQVLEKTIHTVNPNALVYGEGWDMAGNTTCATMMTQSNAHMVSASANAAGAIAVFNDTVRDGLKGSIWDAVPRGYINGNAADTSAAIRFGISGGAASNYWNIPKAHVVNYMSCHDNMTLWDTLTLSCPDSTEEERIARNRLGIGVLMVSQGIPFWLAGEEMLRSKNGNHNSYNASDAINNLNWEALTPDSGEYAMMQYYKGLIEMRKAYEIFRSNDSTLVTFDDLPGGGLVVSYGDGTNKEALVLINPSDAAVSYQLKGSWKLIVDATHSGSKVLRRESGTISVAPCSLMVLVK